MPSAKTFTLPPLRSLASLVHLKNIRRPVKLLCIPEIPVSQKAALPNSKVFNHPLKFWLKFDATKRKLHNNTPNERWFRHFASRFSAFIRANPTGGGRTTAVHGP